MIADATMQSPGNRPGASPPATPKLMMLRQPAPIARRSKSVVSRPRQATSTPGPAAIRASKASPTRAITDRCDRALRSSALSGSGNDPTEAAPSPSIWMSGLLQVSFQASRQASRQVSRQASLQPLRHPVCGGNTLKVGHDQENLLGIIELSVDNRPIMRADRPGRSIVVVQSGPVNP